MAVIQKSPRLGCFTNVSPDSAVELRSLEIILSSTQVTRHRKEPSSGKFLISFLTFTDEPVCGQLESNYGN